MASNKIGKVSITLEGEYSSNKDYVRLDVVTFEGSSYVCKKACKGIVVSNTEFWQQIASKGDKPLNGVDYNTEQEKQEFKQEVVSESKEDLADFFDVKKQEITLHTETEKSELDTYELQKEANLETKTEELKVVLDEHKNLLKNEFDVNATAKTETFNTNAETKTNTFNQNVSQKINEFDEHVEDYATKQFVEDYINSLNGEESEY